MVKAGSLVVATFSVFLGLFMGSFGLFIMAEAGSFASADHEEHSGFLGLWGDRSSDSAAINTPAIIGLIIALVGASALLFGLRALFVTFQSQTA